MNRPCDRCVSFERYLFIIMILTLYNRLLQQYKNKIQKYKLDKNKTDYNEKYKHKNKIQNKNEKYNDHNKQLDNK